jgi:prevent-host-death family protein
MKIAPVADVKAHLSAYLRSSTEGPIVVTRKGKSVAVILAVEDDEEVERLLLAYSPKFQRILRTARQQIEATGGLSHEKFWKDVEPGEPKGPG